MRKQSQGITATVLGIVALLAFVGGYTTKGFLIDSKNDIETAQVSVEKESQVIKGVAIKTIEADKIITESEEDRERPEEFTFTKTLTSDKPSEPVEITPSPKKAAVDSPKPVKAEEKKEEPKKAMTPQRSSAGKYYAIQVGSFADNRDAEHLRKKLAGKGYDAFIVVYTAKGKKWSRVRVGGYRTEKAAIRSAENLEKKEKLPTMIVSYMK